MSETASFFDKKIIFVVLTTDFWRILFYNADDEIGDVRSIWQVADLKHLRMWMLFLYAYAAKKWMIL